MPFTFVTVLYASLVHRYLAGRDSIYHLLLIHLHP